MNSIRSDYLTLLRVASEIQRAYGLNDEDESYLDFASKSDFTDGEMASSCLRLMDILGKNRGLYGLSEEQEELVKYLLNGKAYTLRVTFEAESIPDEEIFEFPDAIENIELKTKSMFDGAYYEVSMVIGSYCPRYVFEVILDNVIEKAKSEFRLQNLNYVIFKRESLLQKRAILMQDV